MTRIKEQASLEQLSVLTPGAKMIKNLLTENRIIVQIGSSRVGLGCLANQLSQLWPRQDWKQDLGEI